MKRPIAFALVLTIVCFLSGSAWSANGKFNAESSSSPKIRDLYLVIIRDPDAQLLELQRGQADILGDLHRPVDVDTLADDPRVTSRSSGATVFSRVQRPRFPVGRARTAAAAWQFFRERVVRDLFGSTWPLSTFLPVSRTTSERRGVSVRPRRGGSASQTPVDMGRTGC